MKSRQKKGISVMLCAAALLAGCAAAPATSAATQESAVQAPAAAPATPESAGALTPVGNTVLDYDAIQPILQHSDSGPARQMTTGYFTMEKDGLWGVLRADGTEVLPCENDGPVLMWYNTFIWRSLAMRALPDDAYAQFDSLWTATTDQLLANGDPCLDDAHDGTILWFYLDTDLAPSTPERYTGSAGSMSTGAALESDYALYGAWLPCRLVTTYAVAADDPDYGLSCPPGTRLPISFRDHSTDTTTFSYSFCNREGQRLADGAVFDDAGWFGAETIAPAARDGKWGYVSAEGPLVTDFVYDGITVENTAIYGYDLRCTFSPQASGGYAAVCRGGKWGVIDAGGQEIVPCAYGGAANYRGNVWLKESGGWRLYALPGAGSTAPTLDLGSIVAPDTVIPYAEWRTFTATADSGLVLRAGPGTGYPRLDTIPKGASLDNIGESAAAPGWMLTYFWGGYGMGSYGWVSTGYLA